MLVVQNHTDLCWLRETQRDQRDLKHPLVHAPVSGKSTWQAHFTGGTTGFFGEWMLESMAYRGRELQLDSSATMLCRNPEAGASQMPHLMWIDSIRLVARDLRNFNFPNQNFDFVIHAVVPTSGAKTARPPDLRKAKKLDLRNGRDCRGYGKG
jgi:hypothetical protein